MDVEIQKAIRTLGSGLRAKSGPNLPTKKVLELLQIEKIYLISGIFQGIFLSLAELAEFVKVNANSRLLLYNIKEIDAWLTDEKRTANFKIACPGEYGSNRDWWPREWGCPFLEITIIDLNNPTPGCCAGNKFVNQLGSCFWVIDHNKECKESVCTDHLMTCQCGQDMCPACTVGFASEAGDLIDWKVLEAYEGLTFPICEACASKKDGYDERFKPL